MLAVKSMLVGLAVGVATVLITGWHASPITAILAAGVTYVAPPPFRHTNNDVNVLLALLTCPYGGFNYCVAGTDASPGSVPLVGGT